MEDTASRLTSCYNRLWETEKWPKVWKKGACCEGIQERRFARVSDFTTCH